MFFSMMSFLLLFFVTGVVVFIWALINNKDANNSAYEREKAKRR